MKKKLALILSIVLVLGAVVCVFAFSASADEVPFAEQQANDVWNAATNKVTSVVINGATVNATETPVELSTLADAGFTSGTYTLVDGVLTLDAPVHTLDSGSITATGDLKVVVNNGDWRGVIRNNSATTDACLIVTSETGHKIVASNANSLRSKGWLIVYGNVGLNIDRSTGQAIVKEGSSGSAIIAPEVDSVIKSINGYSGTTPAYQPTIEVRSGDLIFAGSAKISIQNDTAANASTGALVLTSANTSGSVQVIEDVSLDITTVGLSSIRSFASGLAGKDAILINTTGTVKMAATAFDCVAWGKNSMIQAETGSIRISSGKVLMSQHIATQTDGAALALYAHNSGGGTTSYTDGVYVEGSAELAIKQTSVPTAPYVAGIWVNGGVVDVSDDAKLTVQTPDTTGSNYAIHVKLGAVNISDNAKVHLTSTNRVIYIDINNNGSTTARTGLWNTISDESRAYWTDNGGIHVSGGQLEAISRSSLAFDTVDGIGDVKNTWTENFDFSGGVVLARVGDSSDYIFGAAFDSQDDISNAAFVGNFFRDTSATWEQAYDRSGKIANGYRPEWGYFASNAVYTYYNGISENADFFGTASNVDAAIVDVTYDANGVASYTYTVPFTTRYKIGDKVYSLAKNDVLVSSAPLSLAMTTAAISGNSVRFTDTDGTVHAIIDDASDDAATAYTALNGGTVSYNDKTKVVSLNGVAGTAIAFSSVDNFTVDVNGENSFTSTGSNSFWANQTPNVITMTVTGDAATDKLTVSGNRYVLGAQYGDLVVSGAVTLNVSGAADAIHVSNSRNITVKDSATVVATVASDSASAIRTSGSISFEGGNITADSLGAEGSTVQSGGSLTVGGQDTPVVLNINSAQKEASKSFWALNSTGANTDLTIGRNATVNVWAGYAAIHKSNGGNLTIKDGAVVNVWANARSVGIEETSPRGAAIMADNANLNIDNATVVAAANGNEAVGSFGTNYGTYIKGGTLTITSNYNASNSYALFSGKELVVSGGIVTVNSEQASASAVVYAPTITVSGGTLDVNAKGSEVVKGANINVTGGTLDVDCTGAGSWRGISGNLNVSEDQEGVETNVIIKCVENGMSGGTLNITGGTVTATATNAYALRPATLKMSGGEIIATSPANGSYKGTIGVENVEQTGGDIQIYIKNATATNPVVGLKIEDGANGSVNFNGGSLTIKDVAPVSAPSQVLGIWTNSADLNFAGTDVSIDLTETLSTGWVTGIKLNDKWESVSNAPNPDSTGFDINITGGSFDFRGVNNSTLFRLDSPKCELNITGGEVTGVAGYFYGTAAFGDGYDPSKINFGKDAKIDVYYNNNVNGWVGTVPTITDNASWLKNSSISDSHHWLTTGNWDADNMMVMLRLSDGTNVNLNLENRNYPASGDPVFALSAEGELLLLDSASVEAGKILRVDAQGNLKLNIPEGVTVNLGSLTTDEALKATGSLTVEGKGKLVVQAKTKAVYAIGDVTIGGDVVLDLDTAYVKSTVEHTLRSDAALTVKDNAQVDVKGACVAVYAKDIVVSDNASLTSTAYYEAGGSRYAIQATNNMTVSGGTVTASAGSTQALYVQGKYTQTNGSVTVTVPATGSGHGMIVENGLDVTGGTLTVSGKANGLFVNGYAKIGGTAKVTASTSNSGSGYASLYLTGDADLTLEGNAVLVLKHTATAASQYGPRVLQMTNGDANFNGGTLYANCDEGSTKENLINVNPYPRYAFKTQSGKLNFNGTNAVIAGASDVIHTQNADINFTAGNVYVYSSGGSAIRTQGVGNINISGTAVVESSAPAGNNAFNSAGTINITGGTVTASARAYAILAYKGVNIAGGTVNATALSRGTVTGNGGIHTEAGGITISGGDVNVDVKHSWGIRAAAGDISISGNADVNVIARANGQTAAAVHAQAGSVIVTGGKLSVDATLAGTTDSYIDTKYTAGIAVNPTDATGGLKISGGEVVVKTTNSGATGAAIIVNNGVLDVTDEGKFAVYAYGSYGAYAKCRNGAGAIVLYPGTMNVADNAKVYLYHETSRGIALVTKANMADSWKTAGGVKVSGGQLEIYGKGGCIPFSVEQGVDVGGVTPGDKYTFGDRWIFTGGVVLAGNEASESSAYIFDSALSDSPANYVFAGPMGRSGAGGSTNQWGRANESNKWAYWGEDASYQMYDPLGVSKGVFTTKISDAEWTFTAPSTSSSNVPQYDINGTVVALEARDRFLTDSNPVVKLTKGAEYTSGLVVVDTAGLVTFLDGAKTTDYNNGMITYNGTDAAFNNVSGVAKIVNYNGDINATANGTNVITGGSRHSILWASDNLSITNNGTLSVTTNGGSALRASKDVSVTGGTLILNVAASHAINSNGDIALRDLALSVNEGDAYTNADFVITADGATSRIIFDNVKGYIGGYRSLVLLAANVSNGSINFVDGTDLDLEGSYYAIFTQNSGDSTVHVSDSTLEITMDGIKKDADTRDDREARAIYCYSDIVINNSTVNIATDGIATSGTIMANGGDLAILDSDIDIVDNRDRNNDVNGNALYATGLITIQDSEVDVFSTNRNVINSNGLNISGDSVVNADGYRATVYIRGTGIMVTDNAVLNATTLKVTNSGGGHYDAINTNVLNVFNSDLSADGYPVVTGWASSENGIKATTYTQTGGTVTGGIWSTASCNGKAFTATNVSITGGTLNVQDYHNGTKFGAAEIYGDWNQTGGVVNITTYTGWAPALSFQSKSHSMILTGDAVLNVQTAQGDAIRFIPAADSDTDTADRNLFMLVAGNAQLNVPNANAAIRFSGENLANSKGFVELVFTENAVANLNGNGQVIISDTDLNANQTGTMEVSGNAVLNVNNGSTYQGIEWRNHASNPGEITIGDNAEVTITNKIKNSLQAGNAKLTVSGNAQLTASVSAQNTTWGNSAVVQVHDIVIADDAVVTLTNENVAAGSPFIGLGIVGSSSSKGTANFNGGTLTVNMINNNTSGAVSANRTYPIWHQHNKEINYAGTDVTLNATVASTNGGGAAGIYTQNSTSGTKFNISGGSIHLNATSDISTMFIIDVNASGIYVSGDAKITGSAEMFFNAYNKNHVLQFSGDPTVDFYAYNGDAIDGTTNIDEGNVSFLPGCEPRDGRRFITTGNATTGNVPSQIIVLDKDGVGHWLYDEDGKRTYGGATRTGDTEVTIENINENAIHANGQIDVTVKGTNTLAQSASTVYTRNGDINISGADDNAVLNLNVTVSNAINANLFDITVKDLELNINKGIANDNAEFLVVTEGVDADITFDNVNGTIHGFHSHLLLGAAYNTAGSINVIDSDLTMTGSRHLIYSQKGAGSTANINITNSKLNLAATDYGAICTYGAGDIVIDGSEIVVSATNKQAIFDSYGEILIKGDSDVTASANNNVIAGDYDTTYGIGTFTIEDGVLEVYTTGGTAAMANAVQNYNGGKVYANATRESSVENGIVGKTAVSYVLQSSKHNAAFNFNGAEVYVYGGNNGVVHIGRHTAKIEVNDGLLMVYATGANAIRAQQGDINIHGGKVIAEAENFTAIQLQNQQSEDYTLLDYSTVNHLDITGGEVYVKALYNTIRTMVDAHGDYKGPMPTEKSDVNISGGTVVSETNITDADFEEAQTLDDGNNTWAAANTKKNRVRGLGSNLIYAHGALNVTGGTVTAGTKDSALGGNECAVYANELNVSGGTLNAYVPTVRHDNAWQTDNEDVFNDGQIDKSNLYGTYGIRIAKDISITGGEVNVIARTQGIRANSGNITVKGDAKVNVEVAEGSAIIVLANETLLIDEDAEVNLKAKSAAINSSGKAVEILGGDVVINANSTTIDISAGDLVIGGDAKVDLNTVSGNSVDAQTIGSTLIIKDDAKIDIDITAQAATWCAGIKAYAFEMLGGELDINIDSAPFAKYDQRILSAIDIQGSAYNNGYANLKGGKIVANVNNNYNDANYTTKDGEEDVRDTGSNRTHGIFLKEVSHINFAGTDVEMNLNTQLQNGGSGHITVQNSPTTINISGGELKFNANNDIYALFYHTVNDAKINISGGTITGAAKYFWYASGRMNQVLTVTPGAKIDYFCYSGDSRHLGTYNSYNQTYYNWYVDEGVEYLRGCALDDNSQFVTTGNMTVDGAATQIQITVQEGSKTNVYNLNADNRFYGGDTPETAKAFYTPYGLVYLNNLAAQSIVSNGNVEFDLNGTNTLVKNGNNALYSLNDVTIGGDGVLEMSGADYVFYILGNEIEIGDKAEVKIISTKGNAIHINTSNQSKDIDAQAIFTLTDDAKLTIEATEAYSVSDDGKVSYSDNGRGIYVRGSDAIINVLGNSVLDVTATDQALYALGNDFDDTDVTKATINIGENAKVTADAATALQTNGTVSAININGNAVVDLDTDRATTINGADVSLNVGGNAKLTVSDTKGDMFNLASNALAPEGVKQAAAINVTDNASVVTGTAGSCGARISVSAKDEDGAAVAGESAFNVSGEAFVDMTALGQTVYLSSTAAGGHAVVTVSDKANVNLTNASTTSQYGSALTVNGKKADVQFTTTGTVNITGKSAGWSGALYVTGSDTNVLIKDAKVNVTNIQSTSFETLNADNKNTFGGELSNAMNIGGGEGEFLICGDAVVNAYAERCGEKYTNRAHGLFLHPDMTLKIADNAEANFSAYGDSKAYTGAGIHLKESHIVVTDNGTLRASASGTSVAGITFEGESSLTVNKYGAAFIDGGEDAAGARGYTKATEAVITAKDGARVLFTGAPALDLKNGSFEFSVSEVEAGEDKKSSKATAITVVQREYEDLGYVLLKGHMRNPNTSDLVITSVVIAAIVAAAAAVAIILIRKKKSQD